MRTGATGLPSPLGEGARLPAMRVEERESLICKRSLSQKHMDCSVCCSYEVM